MTSDMDQSKDGRSSVESSAPKSLSEVILDLADIVARNSRFLFLFVFVITVTATTLAILSPKVYRARAVVVPAEKPEFLSSLESVSGLIRSAAPLARLSGLGQPTEIDRYVGILKSEHSLMRVINEFNLTQVYEITAYPREKTMKELLSNLDLVITDEGNLQIDVYDRDPQRAAKMADFFVQVLNEINTELQVQSARASRQFIEDRYRKNIADIDAAQDSLKRFQLEYGVLAMPEQLEASIKAGAEFYAEIARREVEWGILKRTLAAGNPMLEAKRIEVQELKRKWDDLNSGKGVGDQEMKILVPFRQAPALGADFIRLYREVEIQYKIMQFIVPLYEQAKVEENRNIPSVLVLDKPSLPERKAKPKISLYGLVALVSSLVIGLFIVFLREAVRRIKGSDPGRFQSISAILRSNLFGFRFRKRRA